MSLRRWIVLFFETASLHCLQAELERLRQQHKERDAQVNAERMAAATAATMASRPQAAGNSAPSSAGPSAVPFPVPAAAPDEGPPAMTEELVRTLKVCTQFVFLAIALHNLPLYILPFGSASPRLSITAATHTCACLPLCHIQSTSRRDKGRLEYWIVCDGQRIPRALPAASLAKAMSHRSEMCTCESASVTPTEGASECRCLGTRGTAATRRRS